MTDRYESRASTHADDCWAWGPAHYECAIRKIEELVAELREMNTERLRLRDEMNAMREDAERYRWLRSLDGSCDADARVIFDFGFDWIEQHGADLDIAIDQARGKGGCEEEMRS